MSSASNHRPTKRRNIYRWMENRLRRLEFACRRGIATPRQQARASQLADAIRLMEIQNPIPDGGEALVQFIRTAPEPVLDQFLEESGFNHARQACAKLAPFHLPNE